MAQLHHKFIETSNVEAIEEMVNMIVAQRAYEMNSRTIQTSDTMLGIANGLKR
jgi:flagellar basal-body rod protein FlgG